MKSKCLAPRFHVCFVWKCTMYSHGLLAFTPNFLWTVILPIGDADPSSYVFFALYRFLLFVLVFELLRFATISHGT